MEYGLDSQATLIYILKVVCKQHLSEIPEEILKLTHSEIHVSVTFILF